MISLIVARARDGAIGKNNEIPWHAPEDLAFFQRETLGGAVIMGRRTWESLPFKPLKNRLNLVVTSKGCGAEHEVRSVADAVSLAYETGYRRIYGIGGASIYAEMIGLADRMLVTEVDVQIDDADTFFPHFGAADWHRVGSTALRDAAPSCVAHEYLRRGATDI